MANVALTIPGRVVVGMALDKFGPRRVFSILMVVMAIPTWFFAFGNSTMQFFVARLFMSIVGAGFVVGIHMTSLWFKPKDIGFAEGFYAGWGNFGSAAAAITIPTIALQFFGGDNGWRWAIALSGLLRAIYGVAYWFLITDGPTADTHKKARKAGALEVSTWKDLLLYCLFIIPLYGVLGVLVYRTKNMGFLSDTGSYIAYGVIALAVLFQIYKALSVNVPMLKAGIPEDDKYPFTSVAALNVTYFANFGAELAVVSMLPMFFASTWDLNPTTAGLVASTFAFVNLWARPLGGYISDRVGNRRLVMLIYMFGIGIGFGLMGLLDSSWPIFIAVVFTITYNTPGKLDQKIVANKIE
nr:MFS transporter [Psychrobacter sanguinis]